MGQGLPVTAYALLGLLTFDDGLTGYELKQRADVTLRFYWTAPAMSQVYSELNRLAEGGLVQADGDGRGRTWRITTEGRDALATWMSQTPAGFPVFKHPVALRLLMADAGDPASTRQMLVDYLEELAEARADLALVRASLVGADEPGQAFRNPALVADWGLAHFDGEARIARETLARLDESR